MKTALIFGVSGQDGSYLARMLLRKGYRVVGASRDAQNHSFQNLKTLGVFDKVEKRSVQLTDFKSLLDCLEQVKPDEIYNFSGQSSVGLSFQQPKETFDSIIAATLNILEAVRFMRLPTKIYNSCSSECFGEVGGAADENTPFHPKSPYGVAKAAAHWAVVNYREAYGLYACSGILFNHESPLRPERFVTQKIIRGALNHPAKLELSDLKIRRDWGWAPEFVDGIYKMLQLDKPEDFVLATGQNHSLEDFVQKAYAQLGLDWRKFVTVNEGGGRPLDIRENRGNASKAKKLLGWQAEANLDAIISRMLKADYGEA